MGDSIGRAAVDFYVYDQFFNLVVSRGLIQIDEPETQHGHTHANHLPGAKVPVGVG